MANEAKPAILAKMIANVRMALEAETMPPVQQEWQRELDRLLAVQQAAAPLPDVPVVAPAPVAMPAAVGPETPMAAPVDRTAPATPALDDSDALPFQAGVAVAPASAVDDHQPHSQTGETAFLSADAINAALPFDDDDVPEDDSLTVEQYASLCVDRVMSPGGEDEVAQRYQIATREALRALDERFRDRFAREGELLNRYNTAYARYQEWLRSQPKRDEDE
jgi:hypothetical protein